MDRIQIGIEVGGTFTDWVVSEGDKIVKTGKVLSTPRKTEEAVIQSLKETGFDLSVVDSIFHGSTVATNVIIERKGPKICLVTTKGFKDIPIIQRQAKSYLFDLRYQQPIPLVSRDCILEADEKIKPNGEVLKEIDLAGLTESLKELMTRVDIKSVAVCLLYSFVNPGHERAIEETIEKNLPGLYCSLSSDVLPQFREYERASTVLITSYLKPIIDKYMENVENELEKLGLKGKIYVMQANGGMIPASGIRKHAARMILSGPAAGVVGGSYIAKKCGISDIITFDMGGTSTDVCLVTNGTPKITTEYKIDRLPLQLPMLDIITVGAGGGSIAHQVSGGLIQVGPESSGAEPGPACYGRGGTEFTVTDANVLKGLIRPKKFFGGKMELDLTAAQKALEKLSSEVTLQPEKLIEGVINLVNSNMARAMRLISIERGHDPRDCTIVAFGGAGPLHAALVAEEIGVSQVLIPWEPGLGSAKGLLVANIQQDWVQTSLKKAEVITLEEVFGVFDGLKNKAFTEFDSYNINKNEIQLDYFLDMRYKGQAYELTVPVNDLIEDKRKVSDLTGIFNDFHRQRYGHSSAREGVEVVNYRIVTVVPSKTKIKIEIGAMTLPGQNIKVETDNILINGEKVNCLFYDRLTLSKGLEFNGPAVVEEPTSTTYIPLNWGARIDKNLNIIIRRNQ